MGVRDRRPWDPPTKYLLRRIPEQAPGSSARSHEPDFRRRSPDRVCAPYGVSDLHVTQVTVQPGGTSGWHSHLGPSLGIVKSGTATFYRGDDPTCMPHVVTAGSSFFEPAGAVHILRNEGTELLVNVVVQLVPTDAPRRIDEPDPGNCPF
jgi:quercetin dioxygenase-like cupin family protein